MMCVHCKKGRVSRPRGLCWRCFYKPRVRQLYQSASKYGRRGPAALSVHARPVLTATDASPGSPEKIAVLARRAELGQELWHPDDATFAGPVMHGQAG